MRDDKLYLKTLRRAGARARPAAPARRCVLRSRRTARRFEHRRAGPVAGDARGQRDGVERARLGLCRIARAARLFARHRAFAARRAARTCERADLVVRRKGGARVSAGDARRSVRDSHLARRRSERPPPARLRRRPSAARRLEEAHRSDAGCLHDPGTVSGLACAALRREHDRRALGGAARVRDRRHGRRLVGDAGRLHAARRRAAAVSLDAIRQQQRRYVGAVEPSELDLLAAAHADDARRSRAQASHGVEPRRREPVLGRPLRRTRGEQRAARARDSFVAGKQRRRRHARHDGRSRVACRAFCRRARR